MTLVLDVSAMRSRLLSDCLAAVERLFFYVRYFLFVRVCEFKKFCAGSGLNGD